MSIVDSYKLKKETASYLKITLDLRGDISENNVKFSPTMVAKESGNIIFFIPTIPIRFDDLKKAKLYNIKNPTEKDFLTVFNDRGRLNYLIEFINKTRGIKPRTLDEAMADGVIEQNIDLILSIYFNKNNILTHRNKKYIIHSFTWDNKVAVSKKTKSKYSMIKNIDVDVATLNPNYKIRIKLYLLNESAEKNLVERYKSECKIKKNKIFEDLYRLNFLKEKQKVDTVRHLRYKPENYIKRYSRKNERRPSYYKNKQEEINKKMLDLKERAKLLREMDKLLKERAGKKPSKGGSNRRRTLKIKKY